MYLDQLRNTDIDYSRKLELEQVMLCVGYMMTVANQYVSSHDS
jgi:hypothetical protein